MARRFLEVFLSQQWQSRLLLSSFALAVLVLMAISQTSLTLNAQSGVLALAGGRGATLYNAPAGTPIAELAPGDRLTAQGRSADASWLVGVTADGITGWVETSTMIIPDPLALPIVDETTATGNGTSDSSSPEATSAVTPTVSSATSIPPTATPTATFTAAPPTNTPTPTNTPSPTPSPTAPPTATPARSGQVTANVIAIVRGEGASLLDAPDGEEIELLAARTSLRGIGRTVESRWLLVRTPNGELGWLETAQAIVFGVESLPILGGSSTSATGAPTAVAAEEAVAETGTENSAGDNTPIAQAVFEAEVVTDGQRLNVRAGPGTEFDIVGKALNGSMLGVLARNDDGTWLQVDLAGVAFSDGDIGWVAVAFVQFDNDLERLPISERISTAKPLLSAPVPATGNAAANNVEGNATVGEAGNRQTPTLSGLGGQLAIQTQSGGDIYLYMLETDELRRLTAGTDPALSPDGRQLAFVRGGGANGVYVLNIASGEERRVYGGGEGLRTPAWSPDGAFIVFSRISGVTQCRDVGFGFCLADAPQLSSFPLVSKDLRTLSRVDLNGENFTDLPTATTAIAPDWTADGVVYQSNDGLQITNDPLRSDENDAQANRGVTTEYLHRDPDWQPGGGRIVFTLADSRHQEIYAVNPDGSGLVAYTRPSSGLLETFPHNVAPVWSPDGNNIAFLSNRDGDWGVFVMNADGSEQRSLPIDLPINYQFQVEQSLSWSITP